MVSASRSRALAFGLLVLSGSGTSLAQAIGHDDRADDYAVDDRGRSLRVRFDPAHELRLGVMGRVWREADASETSPAVTTGLALRSESRGSLKHDDVQWRLEHRLFWTTVGPWGPDVAGIPVGETALYRGRYTRHTQEPFFMLPSNPPKRLYFPFDIGVEVETGRARLRGSDSSGRGERLRLVVARGVVLFDPWRSERSGNALQLGIGVRYDVDLAGTPELDHAEVTHRLAPFTETTLRIRWEDEHGRTALMGWASYFPHWDTVRWHSEAIESRLEIERVIVALNDVPVSAMFDTHLERWPEPSTDDVRTELRVLAGLKIGWQLR